MLISSVQRRAEQIGVSLYPHFPNLEYVFSSISAPARIRATEGCYSLALQIDRETRALSYSIMTSIGGTNVRARA
jgi:hypothetical protein